MNPLQEWYDYVARLSRPARRVSPPPAPPSADPASVSLPRQDPAEGSEGSPRLRARRFLAALLPGAALLDDVTLGPPDTDFDLPELTFVTPVVEVPAFTGYVAERPVDPVPWDGDAERWVAALAAAYDEHSRPRRNPAPAADAGDADPPAPRGPAPITCTCITTEAIADAAPSDGAPNSSDAVLDDPTLLPPIVPRLPKHWEMLLSAPSDQVAQHSYKVPFRETRDEMVRRLLDPPLTLEEVARLLGVCPTTVRRYTNRGWLKHYRTPGNQRRFRLSDVLNFLETRAGEIRADAEAEAAGAATAGAGSPSADRE